MEFVGLKDFVDKVGPLLTDRDKNKILFISVDSYYSISKGCGCSRKNRENMANNFYNNLVNILTPDERLFLKNSFNNEKIVFKDGEKVLGEF